MANGRGLHLQAEDDVYTKVLLGETGNKKKGPFRATIANRFGNTILLTDESQPVPNAVAVYGFDDDVFERKEPKVK